MYSAKMVLLTKVIITTAQIGSYGLKTVNVTIQLPKKESAKELRWQWVADVSN